MKTGQQIQRLVIGMMDGMGMAAYRASRMPVLNHMEREGNVSRTVHGVFPSVTNVNNVSIACGCWPNDHGITANSYYEPELGRAVYMNDAGLIRVKTIFQRAAEWGIKSALLTSKKKTAELFCSGTEICLAAEAPDDAFVEKYGQPPDIYSREINYWLWDVAVDLLKTRPDIGLIYVHITDYPMHAWHETSLESLEHLEEIDKRIGRAAKAAPDAAFFFTADHGMNNKKRSYDLDKVCRNAGCPVRFVLSPERDYYIVHHRNLTGCSWIWLEKEADRENVRKIISGLEGVEQVMDSGAVAEAFHTDASQIGDLVVFGDPDTMFGEMDHPMEELPAGYRAHGSLHEMELPLIIYNYNHPLPSEDFFNFDMDLTRFLFRV
jgi:phosphonoacetate hydrolase